MADANPEIGQSIDIGGIKTNFHRAGDGFPTLLIHGSGPGVSAWANWRNTIPAVAQIAQVIAPDMIGFGYTSSPGGVSYCMDSWLDHLVGLLDALEVEKTDIVGNSFGGALALAMAIRHPERVRKLVLMGSAGLQFPLTEGLDAVWGYQPSIANMKALLDIFAFDRTLVTDELAELRYHASVRPGVQEAFSGMFPAPRQAGVDALASDERAIAALTNRSLIIHGRDDKVIPLSTSLRLNQLLRNSDLHVFGQCGHWTQIERCSAFNTLLVNFLAEGPLQNV